MEPRLDKLGRKIPTFDRSAAGKKANETMKELYGSDFQSRNGITGGSVRSRGYFGKLKDEGRMERLMQLTKKGGKNSAEAKRIARENTGQLPAEDGEAN